jgi:hypothetical protein
MPAAAAPAATAPAGDPFRPGHLAGSGWTPPGVSAGAAAPSTQPTADAPAPAAEPSASGNRVIVPSVEPPEEQHRLPIFDSVESSWFGGGNRSSSTSEDTVNVRGDRWSSPADEGWRAAENVETPASGGSTAAGLPRRLPNANLIPGAIKTGTQAPELPVRSPAAVRERLARFQRGVNEGRAAATEASQGQDDQS